MTVLDKEQWEKRKKSIKAKLVLRREHLLTKVLNYSHSIMIITLSEQTVYPDQLAFGVYAPFFTVCTKEQFDFYTAIHSAFFILKLKNTLLNLYDHF